MVLGTGDGWNGGFDEPTKDDADFIALSRQSPEVSRALLRAVELLTELAGVPTQDYEKLSCHYLITTPEKCPRCCREREVRAFIAEINKETT